MVNVNFSHYVTQVTLQTDDMDLAGDVIQSLASYLGIEVYKLELCCHGNTRWQPCSQHYCSKVVTYTILVASIFISGRCLSSCCVGPPSYCQFPTSDGRFEEHPSEGQKLFATYMILPVSLVLLHMTCMCIHMCINTTWQ